MEVSMRAKSLVLALVLVASLAFAQPRPVVQGLTSDRILLGFAMPLSGPSGELGRQLAATIETIFEMYNSQGGIHGRKLSLVKYDCGLDPSKAVECYRRLILEDRVFAVLFGFGSFIRPAYPLFEANKVPWLFPWAPPEDTVYPARRFLFSLFPTSASQIRVQAGWIIAQRRWSRIACVYGDSDSGRSGLETLKTLLRAASIPLVASELIQNDAMSATALTARMARARPDLVFVIGMLPHPASVVVGELKRQGLKADIMLQMSLIGGEEIFRSLSADDLEGLYGGWWGELGYPNRNSSETPRMRDLRLLLTKAHPELFNDGNIGGNVEHGLSVELFIEALRRAGRDLDADGLIKALEGFKAWDTGKGNFATFSPTRREGIAGGYILEFRRGAWFPISKWIDFDAGK
jgi:branched-chain amino acid transport system substrate-binding protein